MENSPAFNTVNLLNVRQPAGAQGNTDLAVMELTAIYSRT